VTRVVTWAPKQDNNGRAVTSIGVFDGVHVGHQALVLDAVLLAHDHEVSSAVVTFDRDPDQIVDPANAAPQLLPLDDKLRFLAELGPDLVLVVPFDKAVAALTPREFLDRVLLAAFRPVATLVGYDFRFGARASGNVDTLLAFGFEHGFDVAPHPLARVGDEPVTSTRVRALVAAGDVESARELLGRPHRLRGEVVHGRGEGKTLGTPTVNLRTGRWAAKPADGVYAGRVEIDGATHAAGVSIGSPPTFPEAEAVVEAHVLGFEGDLYGRTLDLEFLARLRDLARFDTPKALAKAIAADLDRVKELASEA
jgi:riboflavin kinase/FMN adenylyltransferase